VKVSLDASAREMNKKPRPQHLRNGGHLSRR
jgi:hypothetical protein